MKKGWLGKNRQSEFGKKKEKEKPLKLVLNIVLICFDIFSSLCFNQ